MLNLESPNSTHWFNSWRSPVLPPLRAENKKRQTEFKRCETEGSQIKILEMEWREESESRPTETLQTLLFNCRTFSNYLFLIYNFYFFFPICHVFLIYSTHLLVFCFMSFFPQSLADFFYWFIFSLLRKTKRSQPAVCFLSWFHPGISPISMCSAVFREGLIFSMQIATVGTK